MDTILKKLKYIKDAFFWNFLVQKRPTDILGESYISTDHFTPVPRSFAEPINTCTWCKGSTSRDCICGMCSRCHEHCFAFTGFGRKIAEMKGCYSTCELALACNVVQIKEGFDSEDLDTDEL